MNTTGGSRKISNITLSNGMGWSPDDQTFYHIDAPTNTVAAYNFDSDTGAISARRVVVRLPKGFRRDARGDVLDELYITTARLGTDLPAYPQAGGLFKLKLGVCGLPSYKFAG